MEEEERQRGAYASSSAARQPDRYITRVFKLTRCSLRAVDLRHRGPSDPPLPAGEGCTRGDPTALSPPPQPKLLVAD